MTAETFDVVIVGARCAGAALATRLARAGVSVAVVDASPPDTGQPSSTHLIQPPGMDELDLLGIGPHVRLLTPSLATVRLEFDGRATELDYGPGRAAHCVRRSVLDPLLQDAAVEAGATLHCETKVVDVVRDLDGRVRGVEVMRRDRAPRRLLADLVVGADGRHSTVAKLVQAEEYLAYDAPRGCYWAYWPRPQSWDPCVLYNGFSGDDSYVVFPTDGELLLVASAPPVERARVWKADHTSAYLAAVRSYEPVAGHLSGIEPASEVRGVVKGRYFFRAAAGPGWALAGDAGHHKDFIVGLGISDAFRDARHLGDAILDGSPGATERYWLQRDIDRIEVFRWAEKLGAADHVSPLERLIGERASGEPSLAGRLGAVMDGQLSPFDLVPAGLAVRWMLADLLRGRGAALPALVTTARSTLAARRERRRFARHLARWTRQHVGADHSSRSVVLQQ